LSLEDAAVFGAAAHAHARLFARRVLAVPEVVGLTIVPDTGVASWPCQAMPGCNVLRHF
jgi:hypothetical protein